MAPAAPKPNDLKLRIKQQFLSALTKLNDRDTQRAAAEELLSIISECARALGVVASELCPSRAQALQSPYLSKMLTQLKKGLADADSSVREAASEALAMVAKGLCECGGNGQVVIKVITDCMMDGKKELQASACAALGMAAPFIGTPDASFLKDLVKKVNSPAFQAVHALLAAIGSCDVVTGNPTGLMKASPGSFVPLLPLLIGQPAILAIGSAGTGVLGGLASKDWFLRRSCCDLLRAAAMLYGPVLEPEGCWDAADPRSLTARCVRSLDQFCKFDKVKEVRETAREALLLLDILQQYGSQGGLATGWPSHMEIQLREKASNPGVSTTPVVSRPSTVPPSLRTPSPQRAPAKQRSPTSTAAASALASSRPRSPGRGSALGKPSSVNDRFNKAHTDQDLVSDPSGRTPAQLVRADSSTRAARPGDGDLRPGTDLDLTLAGLGPLLTEKPDPAPPLDTAASSEPSPTPEAALVPPPTAEELAARAGEIVTLPLEQFRSMQQQLQEMEQRQRELLSTLGTVTDHSNKTITSLQVGNLEGGM